MQHLPQTCRHLSAVTGDCGCKLRAATSASHKSKPVLWAKSADYVQLVAATSVLQWLHKLTIHCMSAGSALTQAPACARASWQGHLPYAEDLQAVGEQAAQHEAVQAASC